MNNTLEINKHLQLSQKYKGEEHAIHYDQTGQAAKVTSV